MPSPLVVIVAMLLAAMLLTGGIRCSKEQPPSTVRVIEWKCTELQSGHCTTWMKKEYPQP